MIKGSLDLAASGSCKIKANQCVPFELLFHSWNKIHQLELDLPAQANGDHVAMLKTLESGAIPLSVTYQEENKRMKLMSKKQVAVTFDLLAQLQQLEVTGKVIL